MFHGKRSFTIGLLATILGSSALLADHVVTKDGSRLNGKIKSVYNGEVVISTDFAGDITIKQENLASFSSDEPISVRLESGTVMTGTVTAGNDGEIAIDSVDGRLNTNVSKVAATWAPSQEDPEVRRLREQSARKWKYEAAVNISGKSGNSDEFTSGARLDARLESANDMLRFYGSIDRAEQNDVKTSDEIIGGVEYESFFSKKVGWFVRQELETDEFENIDLRSTTGGGLSYRFRNTPNHKLIGRAGLSYIYESYDTGGSDDKPSLDFGLNNDWKFADWGRLKTTLSYTPAFEDLGDYRFIHDSGVDIPLGTSDFWKLRMGLKNEYNSQPVAGNDKLDTTYYTQLILSWE